MLQHRMGICWGFRPLSYSHHTSHLMVISSMSPCPASSYLPGSSSPSSPAPPATAPFCAPYTGRRKPGALPPSWFLLHPHHDGSPLSSLPTPSSKAETGQRAGMRCPKVAGKPSRCVLPPLGDQHPTLGTSARWQQDGTSRMGAQGWVLPVPKGATHVPILPQPSPTYPGWR